MPGRELALELGELGDLARLDELAQLGLDAPADPAQPPHAPARTSSATRDRRGADVSAARRYARAEYGLASAELEQRGEGVEPVGDLGVVHARSVPTGAAGRGG